MNAKKGLEPAGVPSSLDALEQGHAVFSAIMDNGPHIFLVFVDGIVKYATPIALQVLGIAVDDNFKSVLSAQDMAILWDEMNEKGHVNWRKVTFNTIAGMIETQVYMRPGNYFGAPAVLMWCSESAGVEEGDPRPAKSAVARVESPQSSYIADMSHEIKTAMNAVIGFHDLMKYTELTERQASYLEKSTATMKALFTTINNVVDLSKIASGRLELICAKFPLSGLLSKLRDEYAPIAARKGLDLRISSSVEDDAVFVGDSIRLSQVLQNLLNNAFDFTNQGSVSVDVQVDHRSGDQVTLLFTVSDTGCGMSDSQVERLLIKPEGGLRDHKYDGEGSGLAICIGLVHKMQGKIWCDSVVDKGCNFHFTVQLTAFSEKMEREPSIFDEVPEVYDDSDEKKNAKVRILVVEDIELNQMIVKEHLDNRGYTSFFASDGEKAVDMVAKNQYDLVFMDIRMPFMDGLEATREIRKNPSNASLPIIAMTALTGASDMLKSKMAGMNSFITKPLQAEMLYKAIRQWANGRSTT